MKKNIKPYFLALSFSLISGASLLLFFQNCARTGDGSNTGVVAAGTSTLDTPPNTDNSDRSSPSDNEASIPPVNSSIDPNVLQKISGFRVKVSNTSPRLYEDLLVTITAEDAGGDVVREFENTQNLDIFYSANATYPSTDFKICQKQIVFKEGVARTKYRHFAGMVYKKQSSSFIKTPISSACGGVTFVTGINDKAVFRESPWLSALTKNNCDADRDMSPFGFDEMTVIFDGFTDWQEVKFRSPLRFDPVSKRFYFHASSSFDSQRSLFSVRVADAKLIISKILSLPAEIDSSYLVYDSLWRRILFYSQDSSLKLKIFAYDIELNRLHELKPTDQCSNIKPAHGMTFDGSNLLIANCMLRLANSRDGNWINTIEAYSDNGEVADVKLTNFGLGFYLGSYFLDSSTNRYVSFGYYAFDPSKQGFRAIMHKQIGPCDD